MPTLHARAMRRAAEICGEQNLADRLGVSNSLLRWWMNGVAVPPDDVFLKAADILAEHNLEELTKQTSRSL